MERRGGGIKKIFEAYKKDEKKPTFNVIDSIFTVKFFSRFYNVDFEKLENAAYLEEINRNYNQYKELCLFSENAVENKYLNITQKEIAYKLNKNISTIYRNINKLKELKIIKKIGSDRKGYWQIMK